MRNISGIKKANEELNKITRESIIQALYLLLSEKSFNDITITDLVQKAGVSRSAYYRNFENKQDVFRQLVLQSAVEIFSKITDLSELQLLDTWEKIFAETSKYRKIFILLQQNHQMSLMIEGFNEITENQTTNLNEIVRNRIISSGFINTVVYWICESKGISNRQIAKSFLDSLNHLLVPYE